MHFLTLGVMFLFSFISSFLILSVLFFSSEPSSYPLLSERTSKQNISKSLSEESDKREEIAPIRIHPYSKNSGVFDLGNSTELDVSNCSLPCKLVASNDLQTDAVVFYVPNHRNGVRTPPARFHAQQIYFAMSFECPAYYPVLSEGAYMSRYDYSVGYPRNGENHLFVPFGPFPFLAEGMSGYPREYNFLEAFSYPSSLFQKRPRRISWFGGNCGDLIGRRVLVDALLERANGSLYSYGSCLHNADIEDSPLNYHSQDSFKMRILKNHTFDLAFENANCVEWVTEKVFQSMAAGAIPVYMGTPSVEAYIPTPDSIIRVSDFESVDSLLEYLERVEGDSGLLKKHLRWRQEPETWSMGFREAYRIALESSKKSLACRLCETVNMLRREGKKTQASAFPPCFDYKRPQASTP